MADAERRIVNKSELASALDVSLPTIASWLERGMPWVKRGTNGAEYEFDLDACKAWREGEEARERAEEERKREWQLELAGGRNPDGAQTVDPKKRKEAYEAEFLADKLDLQRDRLYTKEDVSAMVSGLFSYLRQTWLSDAAAVARLLGLTEEQARKLTTYRREQMNVFADPVTIESMRQVARDVVNAA